MEEVKVIITISENEYKKWIEYAIGGVDKVKSELKNDIFRQIKCMGIEKFEIEVKP